MLNSLDSLCNEHQQNLDRLSRWQQILADADNEIGKAVNCELLSIASSLMSARDALSTAAEAIQAAKAAAEEQCREELLLVILEYISCTNGE